MKMTVSEVFNNPLHRHFAKFICRIANDESPALYDAALLASYFRALGHACAPLDARELFPPEIAERAPEPEKWAELLRKTNVVGKPGDFAPLILDDAGRLYLWRYFDYESRLVALLRRRISAPPMAIDEALLQDGLERYFDASIDGIEWQKRAASNAVKQDFCVIVGGPGTGKTRTVVAILGLLLEQAKEKGGKDLRIALAAPTGKAAARLKEAIKQTRPICPEEIQKLLPEETTTVHRLLGAVPDSTRFRHDAKNPLSADVVIVDEASMVDLALMTKLLDAVPENARLILLGDKDQLASVEAGNVLGDLCGDGADEPLENKQLSGLAEDDLFSRSASLTANAHSANASTTAMREHILELKKNFRFGAESGIGALSAAVNAGDAEETLRLLAESANGESGENSVHTSQALPISHGSQVKREELPSPISSFAMEEKLRAPVRDGWRDFLAANDPAETLAAFEKFRVLCAMRHGAQGVVRLNALIERLLGLQGGDRQSGAWYAKRPVMVTRNDYQLKLFNGDVGIALPDPLANGDLRVFFLSADGSLRKFLPARLPPHETAFAMTVHKSQGSEFDRLLFILPDRENPLLTRELLYTGITRAREGVEIWSREAILRTAVERKIRRSSGLGDALWGNAGR